MKILHPPIIAWNFMFQRPQQLFTSFAKLGCEAHFIDKRTCFVPEIKNNRSRGNLFLHPEKESNKGFGCDTLYSSYPPMFLKALRMHKPIFSIFDSLDEPVEGVFKFWNSGNAYYNALKSADLVLATADTLLKKAKEYNDNVILVPNGCDYQYFSTRQRKPVYYQKLLKPIVLYSGAIATWVDLKLIVRSARSCPEYEFVIIGADFNTEFPKDIPNNLHILGLQPYKKVAAFVQHADVCIIPFLDHLPEVQGCNPIKMWEYMAAGKPIVSTKMPETKPYSDYWDDGDNFINNITKAIVNDSPKKIEHRQSIAINNSWDRRAQIIIDKVEELKPNWNPNKQFEVDTKIRQKVLEIRKRYGLT